MTPSLTFSHKKTSYITLMDGTKIKGTIKDIDRKKGLIEEIKIKDGNGKKHKLKPKSVKFMYLPPSGLDNVMKSLDMATSVSKWNDEKLEQDLLNKGYIYFENTDVKIKKKTMNLLMQLLNPSFSKQVKVYHDPFAKETRSLNIGMVEVAGGNAKSYYIKAGDSNAAFKVQKKRYKDEFKPLWDDCSELITKYGDKIKWSELTQHVLDYSGCQN
ncbi:MAG: hypothetical protein AB8B69_23625 [Chitinophagales bacterium]